MTVWLKMNSLSFWLIITATMLNKIVFQKALLKFHASTSKHQKSKS